MAGIGPAPTSPDRRARRNADVIPLRTITAQAVEQPTLPTLMVQRRTPVVLPGGKIGYTIELVRSAWPKRTQDWWRMWGESPLAREFTSTDWSELLDTARLHALYWLGNSQVASELRLRVAKFGATPEDRARLRIVFAMADTLEGKDAGTTAAPAAPARRRGPLLASEPAALEA